MALTSPAQRILFVHDAAQLGDTERTLLDIAVAQRHRGAVALFHDGPFAAALVTHNIAVLPIEVGRAVRYALKTGHGAALCAARVAFSLRGIARSYGVLYSNSPAAFLASVAAAFLARRPLVWHLRELLEAPRFTALHVRVLVGCANTRAVRVVASSHAVADRFVAAGGKRTLVHVIHDGVDTTPFDSIDAAARSDVRRLLDVSDLAFVVGCFGAQSGAERRMLEEALEQLSDVHAFAFDGDVKNQADLPRLIAACDVVVQSGESFATSARMMMKVLLSRRPLITVNGPGMSELVEHGVTGIVVAPGDSAALAAAITQLRDEPVRGDELAFAGAADARRRFSSETMSANISRVVDEVLAPTLASRA